MIFICVKWKIKPEYAEQWPELSREFTEVPRAAGRHRGGHAGDDGWLALADDLVGAG